ncbi:MAG TPA: phosphodiester glycosidase family protein [Vicinamibacterales bacterium]|nr:phosphodiester glycosidase family protein [Vicinamibacterales bacterium]HOQ60649.1 phosphodiester glycosidase family protein [Vicinamibacterales bacterium]HPK71246.1 phosphodiester glycosidase family protein [Vicinamibacterales bacterium]
MRVFAAGFAVVLAVVSAPGPRQTGATAVPGLAWHESAPGLERTEFDLPGARGGWRTRIVAVRVDPNRFRFRLRARLSGARPAWTVDRAPESAVLAMNAGQFSGLAPWGWLVMGGREIRPPGRGPLSTAVAWDAAGRVRWLAPSDIEAERAAGRTAEAIQSYPTLIDERGAVPRPLREPGLGVDAEHRDARLAMGSLPDGRLAVVITRFNGFGAVSPALPLGLTLGETADVMLGLGCRRAVSLDGGLSAQLLVRERGRTLAWRGWRPVPLGLVAEPAADGGD